MHCTSCRTTCITQLRWCGRAPKKWTAEAVHSCSYQIKDLGDKQTLRFHSAFLVNGRFYMQVRYNVRRRCNGQRATSYSAFAPP
jgi:hypothetical protein